MLQIYYTTTYISDKQSIVLFDKYTLQLRDKGEFINYDMHGFKVVAECISGETVSAAILKSINDNRGSFNSFKPLV